MVTRTRFHRAAPTARLVAALILSVGALGIPGRAATQQIESQAYLEHIKFLSSDELQGRGNGSTGLERAADYIAMQFRAAGLEPGGDDRTYFQKFELVSGLTVGSSNTVTLSGPLASKTLRLGSDYEPLSIISPSAQGPAEQSVSAPLVFVGYGISAPSYNYDDYAGLDVSGKVVLVLRHEPQENDERSVFQGRTHSEHATFVRKAQVARSHGARAILLVEDPRHADRTDFSRWLREPQAEEYGLPLLHIPRASVQEVVGSQIDLDEIMRGIDADLKPRSRELRGVSVTYTQTLTKNRHIVRNVIGILRGSDPARARESVVLGAHYDHLGLSGRFSLSEGSTGQVHNGADDNASGTAAIIEIAKLAVTKGTKLPRSLVFVAFAGEELGLLGSSHYVSHPALPLEQTVAMINLDMVGRANGRILVSGLENAPDLEEDLKAAQSRTVPHRQHKPRGIGRPWGQRRHLLFVARGTVDFLLFRPSCRLSPSQRRLGEDRCARRIRRREPGVRSRRPHRVAAGSGYLRSIATTERLRLWLNGLRIRRRLRTVLWFNSRLCGRRLDRREVCRCARGKPRREGRVTKRRCDDVVWRDADQNTLRLHLRVAREEARRQSRGRRPSQWQGNQNNGRADESTVAGAFDFGL